ncbi:MAG: hypothetical protein Q8936_16405 [Bacillota bacterium]|nr:hypothetical protein [Bacillota bacterium]
MLEKSFGEKLQGIEYRDRVGAYAIIFGTPGMGGMPSSIIERS